LNDAEKREKKMNREGGNRMNELSAHHTKHLVRKPSFVERGNISHKGLLSLAIYFNYV